MEKDLNPGANLNRQAEQSSINAKDILWKYFHYLWLFTLTTAIALTIAWLYLRYAKPLYSVSSTLLIRNESNKSGGMNSQDMFADIALFQANTNKQNEILILMSRTMMGRVVSALDLQTQYAIEGNVKSTNIFPDHPFDLEILHLRDSLVPFSVVLHFSNDWRTFRVDESKEEIVVGQEFATPTGKFRIKARKSYYTDNDFRDFQVSWMPAEYTAMNFLQALDVKPANDQSNVLSLTYVHENPRLATAILNELMNQYNDAAIEDKNEMNRKILTFINDRLKLVESQLDSVEGNLQRFRSNRQVIDLPAQSEMYFGNLTQLNDNLRQQELQFQVVRLLEDYISQPSTKLELVPSTLGLTDPTLLELTAAYNRLVAERQRELQTGATVNNPAVRNIDKNLEEARVKMLQSLSNIKKVYSGNIDALKRQTGLINKEISSIPEREKQSRERAREQEIKQNLYLYLMQKREESEIAQASTISNSRIIDNAISLYTLISPIPLKIYGIAILIGLFLPIIIIYIIDVLNDKVTTRSDITKVTDAPIIGEVGHSEDEKVLLFPNSARTIVAEQMRILRSNLRFVLTDKAESPTIIVTSSFSGEGKSFISTNLGATLAISGKKTVILEFDLRKPKIIAGLSLPKTYGLTNYLVGSAKLEDLPQPVPQLDDLFVIPSGPVPPNPSELLLTPKIADLFKWLRETFDAIVIDTAPVGLVSDAFTLSQYADATIYVVRQRYTFKRQLSFIDDLYVQKKLPQMGILVNDVVAQGSRGYYGYGGGSYGYGYGYGYSYGASYFEKNGHSKKKGIIANLKGTFDR